MELSINECLGADVIDLVLKGSGSRKVEGTLKRRLNQLGSSKKKRKNSVKATGVHEGGKEASSYQLTLGTTRTG